VKLPHANLYNPLENGEEAKNSTWLWKSYFWHSNYWQHNTTCLSSI